MTTVVSSSVLIDSRAGYWQDPGGASPSSGRELNICSFSSLESSTALGLPLLLGLLPGTRFWQQESYRWEGRRES